MPLGEALPALAREARNGWNHPCSLPVMRWPVGVVIVAGVAGVAGVAVVASGCSMVLGIDDRRPSIEPRRGGRDDLLEGRHPPRDPPLRVAKALGDRGLVGSICPPGGTSYELTMNKLADRLARRLTS